MAAKPRPPPLTKTLNALREQIRSLQIAQPRGVSLLDRLAAIEARIAEIEERLKPIERVHTMRTP